MTFRRATRWATATATGLGAAVVAVFLVATPAVAAPVPPDELANAVSADSVLVHLNEFQAIADANGGNRALGTPGYEASGEYVESVLTAAGYAPQRQVFTTLTQEILAFDLTVTGAGDVPVVGIPLENTPGTVPAPITATIVPPANPLGCDAAAWAGVDVAGQIALVSRGDCTFAEKTLQASAAGAAGVLIYNNVPGELIGVLGEPVPGLVPSVGISDTEGAAVLAALAAGNVSATLLITEQTVSTETFNIIADTPTGRTDNTVMLGAHLDSVPEGAGINDNGSGSAAILDVAVKLAAAGELDNQVRFAWWGAEEVGLVGSNYYVDDLATNNPAELDQIATYLNFDMVGSPNYVMSVYDANQSSFAAPVPVPEGSIATESVFTDYFDSIGQPWIDTAFDGRSDYDGFIANGVPASGLFTGADDLKTAEEAAVFGGVVGEAHDPNYHSPGDDITNVNLGILDVSVKAIAFATASLANDTSAINGVLPPVAPAPAEPAVPAPAVPPAAPAPAAPPPVVVPTSQRPATSTTRELALGGVDGGMVWTVGGAAAVVGALGVVLVLAGRQGSRGRARVGSPTL
jgi:Zn-dependent M28 family amino/carboxypeptidase